MNKIPLNRAILYLICVGLLPLFFVLIDYSAKKDLQTSLDANLSASCEKIYLTNVREHSCKLIRDTYQDKDHFYLEKHVGTIPLLSQEVNILQKILNSGFHPEEEVLRRRYALLTGPENCLTFSQSPEKSYAGLKESVAQLSKSVEVSVQDLHKILARVEGVQIGEEKPLPSRPHLIITDFKIEKKKGQLGDVYALNLKILKREYLK